MANGKSIILHLMNGSVSGLCKAEQDDHTTLAYRIPRAELKHCEKYEGLSRQLHTPGVYFMFGQDYVSDNDNIPGRDFVYIGEGKDVLQRVRRSHPFEDESNGNRSWKDVIILVAEGFFDKGKILYLEKRFLQLAKKAGRYHIVNSNKLDKSETDVAPHVRDTLEDIIENARLLLFSLGGYSVLEPQPSRTNIAEEDYLFFSRKTKNGVIFNATGVLKEDGFWVLKDSFVSKNYKPQGYRGLREQYKNFIKNQKLTGNIRFDSPSAASTFVCGRNSNGLIEWKNKDGISLKYLDDDSRPEKPGSSAPVKTKRKIKQKKTGTSLPAGVKLLHFSGEKFHAEGYMIDDRQIVVLKDSRMSPDIRKSCDDLYRNDRNDLIKSGKVKDFVFSENVTFPNTSRAAAVIAGGNSSGPDSWKDAKGRKLKDIGKR